jgi:hypothetical protein
MKEGKPGQKKMPAAKFSNTKSTSGASRSKGQAERKDSPATKSADRKKAPAVASAPQAPIVEEQPTLPATRGKVAVFGGPKDRGMKPDDKLALPTGPHSVYERVRSLNPKSFYCAMRWNYHVQHMTPEEVKRWWANKKLLVTNPKNGNAVVVRAVDSGPHESTGLDIGISPGAAEALEVEVSDEVQIALADPKLQLGKQ